MADTKISALTAVTTLDGTEVLPVVQSSTTKKVTAALLSSAGGAVCTSDLPSGTHVAGYNSSASFLTATGYDAASASSGVSQTVYGYQAGFQAAAGDYLTAIGHVSAYTATGDRISALGYGAAYAATGSDVVAVGSSSLIGTAHSNVVGLGTGVVSTASNQMIVGVAGNAINTWVPGHDPDTYWDIATADTVKHYAGGVKVLEINETGSAPFMGFFGTAAVAKPTGVAVDAAGIHAALVTLGLIAA